ncbi:MAG TPA: hypothetical protein VIZ44_12085 [Gaiellaceae bacterium]|jgi:hypothetical protein
MEQTPYRVSSNFRRLAMTGAAIVLGGLTAFAVYDGMASSPKAAAVTDVNSSARVEPVGDAGLKRVVLIPSAAKRLDIETARVAREVIDGKLRTVIPYSGVLYDANGATWTYTSPKPLVYIRHDIRVDDVRGNIAVLSAGPRVGTRVVKVGSAELWGIEYGDIEED